MASVNKVIVVGNLGRDPEMRTFPSGDQVANVTIATTDKWKDKQTGEMKEATEWHRVVFNGRLAEPMAPNRNADDQQRGQGENSVVGQGRRMGAGVTLAPINNTLFSDLEETFCFRFSHSFHLKRL